MNNNINMIQFEIINEFNNLESWEDKYRLILKYGKENLPFKDEYKLEKNIINQCQSRVWLFAEYKNKLINFYAHSDSFLVKGIIAILLKLYNHRTPDEIIITQPNFIDEIGFNKNLSSNRAIGISAIIKQIKNYAIVFKTLSKD